jgi:hypothetical protein
MLFGSIAATIVICFGSVVLIARKLENIEEKWLEEEAAEWE